LGLVGRRTILARSMAAVAAAVAAGTVGGCAAAVPALPGRARPPLLLYLPGLNPARVALEQAYAHDKPKERPVQFVQQFAAGGVQPEAGELLSLSGGTQPLDPYLRARNWRPGALLPGLIDAYTQDATIYALPLLLELCVLVVHRDGVAAAGLPAPGTTLGAADLIHWASAARLPASAAGVPYAFVINGWEWVSSRVWGAFAAAYGGALQDGGQADLLGAQTKAGLRALVALLQQLKAGWSVPPPPPAVLVDLDIPEVPDAQTAWYPFPAVGSQPVTPAYVQGAGVTAGRAGSEADADALVAFVLWLYEPAQQALLQAYGWPPVINAPDLLRDWQRGSLLGAAVRSAWAGGAPGSLGSVVAAQSLLPWELRGDAGMPARRLVGTMIAEAARLGGGLPDAMITDVSQALRSAQSQVQSLGAAGAFTAVQQDVARVQAAYGWDPSAAGDIISPEE